MIPVSDMLSFLKAFTHLHHVANVPMHPVYAGTLSTLLDACEAEVIDIERARVSGRQSVSRLAEGNVVHLNFNRPSPPTSGGAA